MHCVFCAGLTMDDSLANEVHGGVPDGSDAARVAALERRVAALEKVVAIERKLRAIQTRAAPPAMAPDGDATVLHRVAAPQPAHDESTVLYRSVAPLAVSTGAAATAGANADSTVLHRSGAASVPSPAATEAQVLAPGSKLFEYRIDAVLGQGGFGVTYLATDVHLKAKVAIKEYLPVEFGHRSSDQSVSPRWPDDQALYQDGLDNFLVEARTLATFRHPNIMRVARFFEANRTAYMVLEYERGKSLKTLWPARKKVSENDLLSLWQPLLDGLAVVHASGVLHRDIKPDNIYVRRVDGSLVLLDFGVAR